MCWADRGILTSKLSVCIIFTRYFVHLLDSVPGHPHHLSYPSPMQGSDMPSTTWSSFFLSLQWLDPDAFIRWLVVPTSVGSLIGPSLMMGRLNQQWGRQWCCSLSFYHHSQHYRATSGVVFILWSPVQSWARWREVRRSTPLLLTCVLSAFLLQTITRGFVLCRPHASKDAF